MEQSAAACHVVAVIASVQTVLENGTFQAKLSNFLTSMDRHVIID